MDANFVKLADSAACRRRVMGGLAGTKLSAKAFVLQRYPDAALDRWSRKVDRLGRVRVVSQGLVVGIGASGNAAWGDAARRIRTKGKPA